MTILCACLLSLSLADLTSSIERLSAPSALERARGERALVRELEGATTEQLVELLSAADAEPRRRVARALASRDEYLGLALELFGTPLEDVGRQAVRGLVARWAPDPLALPKHGNSLGRDLAQMVERENRDVFLAPRGMGVADAFHALDRQADSPLELVLDPGLKGAATLTRDMSGGWYDLSLALARSQPRAELVGYGVDPFVPRAKRRGWIACVPRNLLARSASDVLEAWCLAAIDEDPRTRTDGLRALVGTGWPAALIWAEARVRAGDLLARGVLLEAAARGDVSPVLTTQSAVRRTLDEFDALIDENPRRAHRRLAALFGQPATTPTGESLIDTLLDGFDELSDASRTARWWVLAAWGSHGADAERVAELARAQLTRDDLSSEALEALIGALALRGPGANRLPLALSARQTERVLVVSEAHDLLRFADAAVDPDPAGGASRPALCVSWLVGRGDVERAVEFTEARLAADAEFDPARALAIWQTAGEAGAIEPYCRRLALARGDEDPFVRRLRFLFGLLDPVEAGRFARAASIPPGGTGLATADLPVLAAIVSGPWVETAKRVVETLQAELLVRASQPDETEPPTALLAAFDRILADFTAQGRDVELDPLLSVLERLMRRAPAPWARELRGRWPLPPRVQARPLGQLRPRGWR